MRSYTPLLAPAFESPPYRRRRAIHAGQILPATASDEDGEDVFYRPPVICSRAAGMRLWRKKGLDERPLLVCQMNPAHASRLVHWATVLEPALISPFDHEEASDEAERRSLAREGWRRRLA
jgi:hypothetical protein